MLNELQNGKRVGKDIVPHSSIKVFAKYYETAIQYMQSNLLLFCQEVYSPVA